MKAVLPIILIGIAITGFFMFTSPTYSELTTLGEQISSYDQALTNANEIRKERDRLVKISNSIDLTDLGKLEKLLPDGIDNIRLILEVESLAQPYGMILRDVKYATDKPADVSKNTVVQAGAVVSGPQKGFGEWDLEFSTQGTYSNFVKFTRDLENNLRIVDIVGVDFSSDNGLGVNLTSEEAYKYNVKIKTYWLKN